MKLCDLPIQDIVVGLNIHHSSGETGTVVRLKAEDIVVELPDGLRTLSWFDKSWYDEYFVATPNQKPQET